MALSGSLALASALAFGGPIWLTVLLVLAWGMVVDGFRPDRYDVTGALVCLVGVAVIMYSPRAG